MPIALDTNVLVRFLAQDDVEQFEIARDIINSCSAKRPAFIWLEALVELVWVLKHSYKYSQNEITATVMGVVSAADLQVETAHDVTEILTLYQNKGFGFLIWWSAKLQYEVAGMTSRHSTVGLRFLPVSPYSEPLIEPVFFHFSCRMSLNDKQFKVPVMGRYGRQGLVVSACITEDLRRNL